MARTVAQMWILRALFACDVGPDRLHRWYYGTEAPPAARAEVGRISSGGA